MWVLLKLSPKFVGMEMPAASPRETRGRTPARIVAKKRGVIVVSWSLLLFAAVDMRGGLLRLALLLERLCRGLLLVDRQSRAGEERSEALCLRVVVVPEIGGQRKEWAGWGLAAGGRSVKI